MTSPLGSLLLSFALVSPPLLAESDDRGGTFLADAPLGDREAAEVASVKKASAPPAADVSPAAANPPLKSPPPFLVPNGSSSDRVKSGGSETHSTTTSSPSSGLRVTPPSSVVSGALRESFRYDASIRAQAVPAAAADSSDAASATDDDSDVVLLPKMAVNERPLPRDLGADIARWRSQAPQNHTRLGTGIHQKDFGKMRVSVMTLFYIPIAVGASW